MLVTEALVAATGALIRSIRTGSKIIQRLKLAYNDGQTITFATTSSAVTFGRREPGT
jgi:hypothetical protein